MVIASLAPVSVEMTLPLVVERVEYITLAVGATVSTTLTVLLVLPVFPAPST